MTAFALRSPFPQEYLCLDPAALRDAWRMELGGVDVTDHHLFLGYRPLVIAASNVHAKEGGELGLFHTTSARPVARIALKRIELQSLGSSHVFFTGERARSHFLPWWQWPHDRWRRWQNARRAGNVATIAAEIDMTRIAYAVPRAIHLAVVGAPDGCNIFPTDLHGASDDGHYLLSLRHSGKACAQVQELGSLALFNMALDRHREVYDLGARHGSDPGPAASITAIDGEWNAHARPAGSLASKTLRVIDHADIGIHRIFRCVIEKEEVFRSAPLLAHTHASPLTWLARRGLVPEILLR